MKRLLPLLFLSLPFSAQDTIRVPADQPAIQEAIAAANAGDLVLVSPGTYNEQIDFLGKAITVRGEAGPGATTIDSLGADEWFDFPCGPVVRMINAEGAGSVLEGFTVTGASGSGLGDPGNSGVFCLDANPTLRDLVITGNSGSTGAGVFGSATLEGCRVEGNDARPYGEGGGLRGTFVVRNSIIANNRSGGIGGGVYSDGSSLIEDSIIDGNIAGNGADGYTGGGYFGPGTLIRCQITNNQAHHYFSGGPPPFDELGTGVEGADAVIHCTIAFNSIVTGPGPGETSGGIKNVALLEGSIVFGNESNDISLSSAPTARYSIVGTGYTGTGVSSANPQFRDAPNGDFFLQPWSPAIDAGDPLGFPDPDGTEPDMGAFFFPQFPASRVLRNGNGVNLTTYGSILDPVVGTTWVATVDAASHGIGATMVSLLGFADPLAPLAFPFGELLVDVSSENAFVSTELVLGGQSVHTFPIPPDYSLGGLELFTQGVVFGSGIALTNAVDLTVGL